MIADAAGPIAIAGVIGGAESAIDPRTTRIVFESANFHAASVRRTSVALKLRTDASVRFEKSQDPVNTLRGLAMAIALLREVSPGIRIVGGVCDALRPLATPPAIDSRSRLAGTQARPQGGAGGGRVDPHRRSVSPWGTDS